jgi:enoyl-CoA hydratase/carnithine racemase
MDLPADGHHDISYTDVRYDQAGSVVTITIDRPEQRNSMRAHTMRELTNALTAAELDEHCRAIVLTGAGEKAFCAGADVNDFVGQTAQGARGVYGAFKGLSDRLRSMSKTTIGAVRGVAYGGGCALSMLTDVTICGQTTRFALPEVNLGIFPMTVMPILFQTVGRKKALQLIYLGRPVGAEEALRCGLVSTIVADDAVLATALEWAETIAGHDAQAIAFGHEAARVMPEMTYDQALEYGQAVGAILLSSPEAQEQIKAFFQASQRRRAVASPA